MTNLLIDLLKKTKLRNPVGNEPKYYPNAGPARREGQASMEAITSFGSQQQTNVLPGTAAEIPAPIVSPSPSVTPSVSATPSASVTPSVTPSVSITPSVTPSVSITPSPSPTPVPNVTLINNATGDASIESFTDSGGPITLTNQTGAFPVTAGQTLTATHGTTNSGAQVTIVGTQTISYQIKLNGYVIQSLTSGLPVAPLVAFGGGALQSSDILEFTITD